MHARAPIRFRLVRPIVALLSALFALGGCDPAPTPGDAGGATDAPIDAGPPARVCRPGRAWHPGMPAFVDRTEDWGLGGINSASLSVGDIDGDGFADLVINHGSAYDHTSGEVFLNHAAGAGARRFEDHTAASGLYLQRDTGEPGRAVSFVRFGDVDNDGDLDAFTGIFPYLTDMTRTALSDRPEILLNDGTGSFTLTGAQTIVVSDFPLMSDGFFFDQDLDGRLDLALGFWYSQPAFTSPFGNQPLLFRSTGGGEFQDVTDEAGMTLTRTSAAAALGQQPRPLFAFVMCDVNGDGRHDIVGAAYGRMMNELFLADGDRFSEIGATTLIGSDDRRDFSDDQSFRCYCVANPTQPACASVPAPAAGYPCPGRGWAPGQSDIAANLGGNTFSYACADVDNDGDMDLYESNIRHPDVGSASDPSELLVNDGTGTFTRPGRETMGLTPPVDLTRIDEGGQHDGAFDFDADGWIDLYLAGSPYPGNRGWLFHHRTDGPLSFEWIGADAGFNHGCPNGTAVADFDHDGDLDMIVGTYGCNDPTNSPDWSPPELQPVRFYENVASENNWLSIRLVGSGEGGANRLGIGARVRLTTPDGMTQTRIVQTSSQNLSTEAEAYFGLGASCDVQSIEIRWPDGALETQTLTDVIVNQRVEITQGDSTTRYLL